MSIWFWLWWCPAMACIGGYIRMTVMEFIKERRSRSLALENSRNWFVPELTVGVVVSRVILSFIPVVNIICLLDLSASTVGVVYDKIRKIMSITLVSRVK